jgi:hypothetical protein
LLDGDESYSTLKGMPTACGLVGAMEKIEADGGLEVSWKDEEEVL